MKISVALNSAKAELKKTHSDPNLSSIALDALLILSHVTSLSKEEIIFNPDSELDKSQEEFFFTLILRRKNYEPLSHIIAKREFFGRNFFVNRNVLDPRPDSEILIELALEQIQSKQKNLKILELGVGSGCLIITLLALNLNSVGVGIDISEEALKICARNAKENLIDDRLQIVRSDLFQQINPNQKFDLIISNPPYIKSGDIENLQPEVKNYEPRIALDGGLDGLDFYHKIAFDAKNFLTEEGKIILEMGFGQKEEVSEIFVGEGFSQIGLRADLSGIDRGICFCK